MTKALDLTINDQTTDGSIVQSDATFSSRVSQSSFVGVVYARPTALPPCSIKVTAVIPQPAAGGGGRHPEPVSEVQEKSSKTRQHVSVQQTHLG